MGKEKPEFPRHDGHAGAEGSYRIEQRGGIKSEWGVSENKRRARFYKLTRTGRKQLEVEEAKWSHLSLATGKGLRTA